MPIPEPSRDAVAASLRYLYPWRALTSPVLEGLDLVPERGPMLLVGNHTIMGLFDAPMLFLELFERRGLFVRGLGDHTHFAVPLWRDLLCWFGVFDGTPERCKALLARGESILLFPGGGREVAKRRGEKYRLIWKERTGFVRLAAEYGAPIVPFAAVGAEEAWDILLDADDLLAGPIGWMVDALGWRRDVIMPIVRGIGPTPIPRPERLYFRFAPPISTEHVSPDDPAACWGVRDRVQKAVEDGIAHLLTLRAKDAERALLPRLVGEIERALVATLRRGGGG